MKINYSFIFLLILSLYIGYINKLLLLVICLLFHELGHIVFIKIFNLKITAFNLSIYGGLMTLDNVKYNNLNNIKKILIYSGGILVNILLYFLFDEYLFGKFNLLLFLINVLPIYPLDGYNILILIIKKTIVNNLSIIFITILLIIAIYNNSYGLLVINIILLYKNFKYYLNKDKIYLLKIINNMV